MVELHLVKKTGSDLTGKSCFNTITTRYLIYFDAEYWYKIFNYKVSKENKRYWNVYELLCSESYL